MEELGLSEESEGGDDGDTPTPQKKSNGRESTQRGPR
jgi:hypothetical protein